jgi:hypothetical protein
MFDMFKSDASQQGYNDGFKDGKDGKSKNFTRIIKCWRQNAIDSYCEGYNDGYKAGCFARAMGL